jgi:hypothetical protein
VFIPIDFLCFYLVDLNCERFVANSEVILFWRRRVWTNFPENGFEQLKS